MLCAISGQAPEEPVVSTKSGLVFEKRLVLQAIAANGGKCPITEEPLAPEDLVPIKVPTVTRPRPTTAASVPGMLQLFQNEWDSLMLETFTLKKQLDTAREELAHALYQLDAACRVIARVKRERDDAMKALATAQQQTAFTSGATATGEAMDVDSVGLAEAVKQKMRDHASDLSALRKRRKVPESLAPQEEVIQFSVQNSASNHKSTEPGVCCLDIHPKNANLAASGGIDSDICLYDLQKKSVLTSLTGHTSAVSQVEFHPSDVVLFSSSLDGTARIWKQSSSGIYNTVHTIRTHSDKVIGLSLHATTDYLATASADQTWALHSVDTGACLLKRSFAAEEPKASYECLQFHPDGLLLGTGMTDSSVRLWDVVSQGVVATFSDHKGKVSDLCFSENGGSEDGKAMLWDLRKLKAVQTFDIGSPVNAVRFDNSGMYFGVASQDIKIFYNAKPFQQIVAFADHTAPVTDVVFGPDAKFILSCSIDRTVKQFTKK